MNGLHPGKRSDFLFITDIDASLLHAPRGLSEGNYRAITDFLARGGNFTLASGRSVESAERYARTLGVSLPTIHINGACIYSYAQEKYLYEHALADSYREVTGEVIREFPGVGIVAWTSKGPHLFHHNDTTNVLKNIEKLDYIPCSLETIPVNPYKMLFICEHGEMPRLEAFLRDNHSEQMDYVATSESYFEMIPKGVSKGSALVRLSEMLGIPPQRIIAVGDYYNDIEMLKAAGLGCAVANAPQAVQQAADKVIGACEDDAIAGLIGWLEETCFCD